MSEYQHLTSKIQVPKEWPVEVGRIMFIHLVQSAIYRHRLGQRIVITVEKVSALVTSNKDTPGYLLEKIEEINDEDTYRIDLILPFRTVLLTLQSSGPHRREEESVQCLPMILKSDHPISAMIGPRSDRHKVMVAVPDLKKILKLKGITGSERYNHALQTMYKIYKVKWLDQIVDQEEPLPSTSAGPSTSTSAGPSTSTSAGPSTSAEQITDDGWNFVFYDRLPPAQRFWCNWKGRQTWICYSLMLVLILMLVYLCVLVSLKL